MPRILRLILLSFTLGPAVLTGCARYEFDLTQPPGLATHVGSSGFKHVIVEPLEYRLRAVENRLVMEIYNPTTDSIELIGPKSVVVDPQGESHPLRSQTIASQSFVKLILPPMQPRLYDPYYYGPGWNMGLGPAYMSFGPPMPLGGPQFQWYQAVPSWYAYQYYAFPYYPYPYFGYYGPPRYFAVYDDRDSYYWDWKGDGEARIQLVFQRNGSEFRHAFSFVRKKL